MKKIFILIALLLLVATASARESGKIAEVSYVEKGYFSMKIPVGWNKYDTVFGLSQEEKKVYGVDFIAPSGQDGLTPRISVHYYAPGNLVHKSADKFIKLHALPVLGVAEEGEKYGPVEDGFVDKRRAKIFERNLFEFVPPGTINPKKIPIYEKFAVVPAKDGFYVLRLYSPGENSKTNLKAYESVLTSFKPLVN